MIFSRKLVWAHKARMASMDSKDKMDMNSVRKVRLAQRRLVVAGKVKQPLMAMGRMEGQTVQELRLH